VKLEILKGREIGKTRALYEEVFQDSREYTDYFYEKVQREGIAFAAEKDGEVVSEMFLLPKILVSGERRIEALYLYGVATRKEYRRQGLMDRLMKEALCYAAKSRAELLYLIPVSQALYEKYGFCTLKQGKVRIWEMPDRKSKEKQEYSFWPASCEMFSDKLCQEIHMLEKHVKEPYRLFPLRDRKYFTDILRRAHIEGGGVYLVGKPENRAVEGIIVTGEEDGEIVIMDVIGKEEKKEEMMKDFVKWEGRKRVKEYVFTVMVKKLKEGIKVISEAGLNDEI